MTSDELKQCVPQLAAVRERLLGRAVEMFGARGYTLTPRDDGISTTDLLVLALWQDVQRCRDENRPASSDTGVWRFAMRTVVKAVQYFVFKSGSGALARLPATFVEGFLRNQTLVGDLIESPIDNRTYVLQRAGATEAEIPASLLDHLMDLRQRGEAAGFLRATGQVNELPGPTGEGTSCPMSRPTKQRPIANPQLEQQPGVEEPAQ